MKGQNPKGQGKPGYYFKIIPKEEFPKFMERLKALLGKSDDKKILDFEVRGTKEDLNGLSLEIFTFGKERYKEFLDVDPESIKDALYYASLNLNAKDENGVVMLNMIFDQLKPMLESNPIFQGKFAFSFRNQGKKVSFDCICKNGKLVEALLDLGIDISEFQKFEFALKSGINLAEILDENANQTENLVKICSVIFSIKSESKKVRYLIGALLEALKDLKLADEKIKKKYDKLIGFLNFINSFIEAKLNVEYDAKFLAGEGAKEAEKYKTQIIGIQQMAKVMVLSSLIPMIVNLGMDNNVKILDLDSISISLVIPKFQNGCAISLKIPGLSQVYLELSDLYQKQEEEKRKKEEEEKKKKKKEEKPEKKGGGFLGFFHGS